MMLISNMLGLCRARSIVDEILKKLYRKLAQAMSSYSFYIIRIRFCSGLYPTKIVKDMLKCGLLGYVIMHDKGLKGACRRRG